MQSKSNHNLLQKYFFFPKSCPVEDYYNKCKSAREVKEITVYACHVTTYLSFPWRINKENLQVHSPNTTDVAIVLILTLCLHSGAKDLLRNSIHGHQYAASSVSGCPLSSPEKHLLQCCRAVFSRPSELQECLQIDGLSMLVSVVRRRKNRKETNWENMVLFMRQYNDLIYIQNFLSIMLYAAECFLVG